MDRVREELRAKLDLLVDVVKISNETFLEQVATLTYKLFVIYTDDTQFIWDGVDKFGRFSNESFEKKFFEHRKLERDKIFGCTMSNDGIIALSSKYHSKFLKEVKNGDYAELSGKEIAECKAVSVLIMF